MRPTADGPGIRTRVTAVLVVLALVVAAVPLATVTAGASTTNGGQPASAPDVRIVEIQQNENGTASPYAGETVTTNGTVTAVVTDEPGGFFIQDGTGQYRGVFVNAENPSAYATGDVVNVTAPVEESFGLTQLNLSADEASAQRTGTATVPEPVVLNTSEAGQEAYEGVLVEVQNLTVTATPNQFGEWLVDDGSGELKIDGETAGDDTTPSETGATIDAITGPVTYSFGEFKVQPTAVENLTAPPSDEPELPDDATNLTVLMYNDIQTAMSNPDAVGRLVGVVDERRAAHDHPTVVVGGGDQIGPNSLGPFTTWETPVDVLNELDPAAEVIGNHDLDYGVDSVSEFSPESEFPWLLANLVKEDGSNMPGTQNYTIVERGNLSIGILGLVDDEIYAKTNIDFDGMGYRLADTVDVGSRIATELKEEENVDVVIAATHIGVPGAERLASNTDNIDVVVTGDDEVAYGPERVNGTAVVEAEGRAAYVGEVNLSVGDDRVVMRDDSRLIPVQAAEDPSTLPVDETTKQLVQDLREQYLDRVAGRTTVALDSRFTNYDDETRWGNFITDAFRNRTGSEVAITNAGGIRGNFVIPPGNVTYDDVYTSLPFGNFLVEKEMTGQQLRDLLASQVTTLDAQFGSGASLQVSGVTYEFIDRPGADTAVRNVFVNGEPLEPDATYTVTVNSFMNGWDRISELPTVETDPTQYGTVVAEYLEARSPITPTDADRIRRVTRTATSDDTVVPDLNSTYTLTFDTPFVEDVAPGTFRIENETSAVVEARSVSLEGETLTVTVNESGLNAMADASIDLQLYGEYNDTEYTHEFLTYAALNTNVPVAVPPTLADSPAQNADDDLPLEDVNGDGEVTIGDVQLFFQSYESEEVQSNADLFDFNEDGEVTIGDVQVLFDEVVAA